jgi:hypothetical protein
VLGHLRDWSSLASLDGAGFPPGYLGEALVYLPLLGSASPVTEALPAVAGAMTSNRAAVTTHCTGACLPRVGSGEREVWVSKALDDDVAAQWMRLHVLGATTPPSALGAIRTALVDRTRSSDHGTLEALDGPSGAPVPHGWWYPRTGAAWAWEGAP